MSGYGGHVGEACHAWELAGGGERQHYLLAAILCQFCPCMLQERPNTQDKCNITSTPGRFLGIIRLRVVVKAARQQQQRCVPKQQARQAGQGAAARRCVSYHHLSHMNKPWMRQLAAAVVLAAVILHVIT